MIRQPQSSILILTLFPYTTLFRSQLKAFDFNAAQLAEINKGLRDHINIQPFLNADYPWFLMHEIRKACKQDISLETYIKDGFDWSQIREIRLGLEKDFDVSIYAKKKYLSSQMREIRKGLELNENLITYIDAGFTWLQLREIRKGIAHKVDIEKYTNHTYFGRSDVLYARSEALYQEDRNKPLRKSHDNPAIQKLYEAYLGKPLSEKAHHLLHTHYFNKSVD